MLHEFCSVQDMLCEGMKLHARTLGRKQVGAAKHIQGVGSSAQELLESNIGCRTSCSGSCQIWVIALYLTSAKHLLRRSAFARQQRAGDAPALQRSHGVSEQRDALRAVSCKGTRVCSAQRTHGIVDAQVASPLLQSYLDEAISTKGVRRLGGATVMLCSTQEVSLVAQLIRLLDEHLNAREDV